MIDGNVVLIVAIVIFVIVGGLVLLKRGGQLDFTAFGLFKAGVSSERNQNSLTARNQSEANRNKQEIGTGGGTNTISLDNSKATENEQKIL